MTRRLTAENLDHLKRWEGLVLYAYDDADGSNPKRFIGPGDRVAGKLTIGYGHTRTVQPGQRITEAEAEALFRSDLAPAESAVDGIVRVSLTDAQFAALVSFAFNLGWSTSKGAPLANVAETLNKGDYAGAIHRLGLYNKTRINGVLTVSPGLVNRRAAEAGLWAKGEFVASASVDVAPPVTAPSPATDTGIMAGVAGAAATAAPFISGLSGVHWAVGVAIVVGAVGLAALWLLKRQRAA
mgnify:CR=1 FL=1